MWRQPKAVWAVAFASVVAFMGIGLVDPILKPIADNLNASPSQVSLLFTSYMAVMGVAMLITGVVSSRIGPKRTLLLGLVIIIAGAGLGIAIGPLVGGVLGSISWRGPFFGVSALMAFALVITAFLLPATPRAERATTLADPFRALRHRGLLGVAITALLYNFGFFTLLAFTPFPLNMTAHQIGLIFFGWGLALAFTSVVVAPRLQHRFGTVRVLILNLLAFTAVLTVMAVWTDSKAVLASGVVIAGLFIGINNTLITETVMKAAPVERGVASAAYSFLRFGGAAVAPWLAGVLGEQVSVHLPYWVGAAAVLAGAGVLTLTRPHLVGIDVEEAAEDELDELAEEATAVTVGSDS